MGLGRCCFKLHYGTDFGGAITSFIDGFQSRDETAMLVDKTIANYGSYFA